MIAVEHGRQRKLEQALFWSALFCAILAVGYALVSAAAFSSADFVVLAASSYIAVISAKCRFRITGTNIEFRPRNVLSFWGAMWLGVAGAVVLGAIATVADRSDSERYGKESTFGIASDIVAAFAAALVYDFALRNYTNGTLPDPSSSLVPNAVIVAAVLMAAAHFAVGAALTLIQFGVDEESYRLKNAAATIAEAARTYSVSVLAVITLYLTIRYFGIEFGLVLLPIVTLGYIGYRIHVRSLALKTREIREASRLHLATVEALATAIDARDQVGIGHVRRTQIYAVGIGNILGLSEAEISALRTGALLHDIGKLAVPDHILNKPGRLTPAEFEKTKIHSSVGASILEKVGFPYPVVPTVKYHHEHWDGNGYPEGLKGVNIPVTARIVTIADTYDTLRGDRPYRRAITREEACDFLRSKAGSQFDPSLIDLFIRNLRVFEAEIKAEGLTYDDLNDSPDDIFGAMHESANPNYVEQIKRANHEVFKLYSLARDFSGALNLGETLSLFASKVGEFVPFDTCVVYLLEESGETAKAAMVVGKHDGLLSGKRIKVGEGATGYVLKRHKPVENAEPALDFAFSNLEIADEYVSMISVPLSTDKGPIGAISLYSCRLGRYEDEHTRLLETVSKIAADAIEKSLQHAEAQVYALTDALTGLPNSRSLQFEFDKEVTRATRSGTSFQVLVLDLDGFKSVNDTFGHKVGDDLLRGVSGVIRAQLREYDFLARYGGDEFIAIVPETDMAYVERLRHRIEDSVAAFALPVGNGNVARVGVSFGSASFPTHGETFNELIEVADRAMYRAKAINRLRNDVVVDTFAEDIHVTFERYMNAPDPEDEPFELTGDAIVPMDVDHTEPAQDLPTSLETAVVEHHD